jgi:VWFA-related protein
MSRPLPLPRILSLASSLVPVLLAALALGPAAPVLAQEGAEAEPEEEAQDFFLETVDVNVVNVDVYVTDKKGDPVTGLTADDFEVFENGHPVAISNFYAIEDRQVKGASAPVAEAGAAAPEAPAVVEPAAAEGLPEEQRLSLIVYVDNLNIRPHNRRRVLQDVRSFLRHELGPQDRVMLVAYDRSLKVKVSFTADVDRVVQGLFELDEVSGEGVHADSDRRDVLQRIEDADSGAEAMMWAETHAESVQSDLRFTIDALRELVSSLAGLPGRKAILHVSDGLPMIPAEDVFYAVEQGFQRTGALTRVYSFDASRRFEELAAHANANRVSFYTIDASGLEVYSSADAQTFQADRAGGAALVDRIRVQNTQAPLQLLAEQTGGKAIINQNRVAGSLEDVAKDFRTYYSLGYTPGHSGSGRFYTIEVKLKDKSRDLVVRHRAGYRDKPAATQMSDGVLAALKFPYYSNPLALTLTFDRGSPREDGNVLVPVQVRVPMRALTLVPRGDRYEANAKLYLAAMDDQGWISEVQETDLPIRIAQADLGAALDRDYVYTVQVLLRSGEQKIAVGLRDEIAANHSFVTGTLRVGR